MNVIIHLPSAEKKKNFQKEFARLHSAAVLSKLNLLCIPPQEKEKIMKKLKKEI